MKKLLLISAALSVGACATVIRGTKDNAHFESTPSGATVTVESISADRLGPFSCITPCELELKRKRDWSVLFELDGYKPVTGTLEPKVTGGGVASGAGNIIAGGIIGIGVDAGTGANLDLRPNPLIAQLEPTDSDLDSRIISETDDEAEVEAEAEAEAEAVTDPEADEQLDAAPEEQAVEDAVVDAAAELEPEDQN